MGTEPLWAELINSDWHDHLGSGAREDRIGNDTWLARFLERAGWEGKRLANGAERQALRELRVLLRRAVDAVRASGKVPEGDLDALNQVLAGAPFVRSLVQAGEDRTVHEVPLAAGIERVLGAVAATFATLLAEGDADRIKVCANPDCGWVFYDRSHNRSRRWCDASECGNLIKVRRHRQRQRDC
jgi:predicted RNA-binding Zn ribbon-like protein